MDYPDPTAAALCRAVNERKLDSWKTEKALSLLQQFTRRGRWASEKQEKFAKSLMVAKRSFEENLGDVSDLFKVIMGCRRKRLTIPKAVGENMKIFHGHMLLGTDKELQWMRDNHPVNGSPVVVIKAATDKSKYKGRLVLTDDGKFPDNEWYGSIGPGGDWRTGKSTDDEVVLTIKELAKSPEFIAKFYAGDYPL